MINKKQAIKYCKNDISLIENYDKAIADKTQIWHCHHRRETIYSRSGLIEIGEYYNRPAEELIFLTPNEHHRLHNLGKPAWNKGKHLSAETRKKMSEALKGKKCYIFGKHLSAETRKKMSEAQNGENNYWFGKHHSEETRKKMSESKKGKPKSAEARKKMSESKNGSYFFNNGVKSIRAKTCPGPEWQRGRIKKKNSGN